MAETPAAAVTGSQGHRRRQLRRHQRRLQDDDPWAGMDDPFADLKEDRDEDEEGEDGSDGPPEPAFLGANDCLDLQLTIQGALILQDACRTNGPAFVEANIGKTTVATRKAGSGSSTPMWGQVLDFGCQAPDNALQLKLFTGGGAECAAWTMRDWLAQSAVNQVSAKDSEDVAANTLVLTRSSDARVNLMLRMSSFVHPKEEKGAFGVLGGSTKDVVLGSVFAGIGFLIVLAISISCCCWCCCPAAYQAQRRRWGLVCSSAPVPSSATTAATTAASATMVANAMPPPHRPASVPRPPPPAASAGRRPPHGASGAPSAPAAGRATPPASLYDRPPPVAPHYQPASVPVEAVAVAMPVAEPVEGLGSTYRGGYAEARIMRAESDARGGGGGGRHNGAQKGNGKR